ncbi:MAG: hypothetical protein KF683_04850 [Rubrivivax sp.]|nr:hypothetical protein [Rubrivivax sp.]
MGVEAAKGIQDLLASVSRPSIGLLGTVLGVVMLLIGATTVFGELQDALDRIWRAPVRATASGGAHASAPFPAKPPVALCRVFTILMMATRKEDLPTVIRRQSADTLAAVLLKLAQPHPQAQQRLAACR